MLRVGRAAQAFAACRRGGAMLYSGATALVLLTGIGATMTNYNWREAQQAELEAAMRAAVSTTAQLLPRVTEAGVQDIIKERTASVLAGLAEGLQVDKDDVTVTHDSSTGITRVTIGGTAVYRYRGLWGASDNEEQDVALARQTVAVTVDIDRYETAIAADITDSMAAQFEVGKAGTKIDALKAAIEVAIGIMEDASAENTGAVTIALVPFGNAVNVGDTSGSGETVGKRRYAHLLGGAAHNDTDAKDTNHWVDTFHHYGSTSESWGTDLQTRKLPIFDTPKSWNLRGAASIDLNDEAPGLGTWNVQREDFWNGCVMARWGAFWDRPTACASGCQRVCAENDATCTTCDAGCWHEDVHQNHDLWPATQDVDAWTPASSALTDEPLHLSDAPPEAGSPNTRFTAYSWPDESVGGTTDARLLGVLLESLDSGKLSAMHLVQNARGGDNDWSKTNSSGDWYCPSNPIVPLTETAATLRTAAGALAAVREPNISNAASGGTYLHLGVVWGLRALSPLWSDIWEAKDAANAKRPLTPCAVGESGNHCRRSITKLIVLITDGTNGIGWTTQNHAGRVVFDSQYPNAGVPFAANLPVNTGNKLCGRQFWSVSTPFQEAAQDGAAVDFNARFANLNAAGKFAGASLNQLVANFDRVFETTLTSQARAELGDMTPWELFRNHGFKEDGTSITDILVDQGNGFGLDGRPVFDDMACRNSSSFGAYGRINDLVQIGDEPLADVAPFANIQGSLAQGAKERLDEWFEDACRIASERGAQIKIVYLNTKNPSQYRRTVESGDLAVLGKCIDAANGNRSRDIYKAPTADELASTFRSIFTVQRSLRFVN